MVDKGKSDFLVVFTIGFDISYTSAAEMCNLLV